MADNAHTQPAVVCVLILFVWSVAAVQFKNDSHPNS